MPLKRKRVEMQYWGVDEAVLQRRERMVRENMLSEPLASFCLVIIDHIIMGRYLENSKDFKHAAEFLFNKTRGIHLSQSQGCKWPLVDLFKYEYGFPRTSNTSNEFPISVLCSFFGPYGLVCASSPPLPFCFLYCSPFSYLSLSPPPSFFPFPFFSLPRTR